MKRSILSLMAMSCIIIPGCGGGSSSSDTPGNNPGTNPESGFTSHFEDTAVVKAIAVQKDGKIIVGGSFDNYDSKTVNGIVRLNADGSIDTSFNTGTGLDFGVIAILIQNDGKIILAGDFSKFNGAAHGSIVRLNSDGSVDPAFNSGTGFDGELAEAILQPDGKILVSGWQSDYNGDSTECITRLNSDGTFDSTFIVGKSGLSATSTISAIALQKDGKVIIGGKLLIDTGAYTYNKIARFNSNGSLDTKFYHEGEDGSVSAIAVQSDDKIILGGSFTKYNSVDCKGIIRLQADGSPDTFSTGTGFDKSVSSIRIQDDGKILVGGDFTSFNGTTRGRIARLNSDGSLDTAFAAGSGADDSVRAITIGSNDHIFVGGYFKEFNGEHHAGIVRLDK